MADQPLLATMTGEHFQPVRLHYRVLNRRGSLRAFDALAAWITTPREAWVWLYGHEAKKLRFPRSMPSSRKAPSDRDRAPSSCERRKPSPRPPLPRARSPAIPFFDRHLPRKLRRAERGRGRQSALPRTETNMKVARRSFRPSACHGHRPRSPVKQLAEKTADVRNPQEKIKLALEELHSRGKRPLPEIERLPVHYAEDGIGGFKLALHLRQMVAMQHWLGNSEYTLDDAIGSDFQIALSERVGTRTKSVTPATLVQPMMHVTVEQAVKGADASPGGPPGQAEALVPPGAGPGAEPWRRSIAGRPGGSVGPHRRRHRADRSRDRRQPRDR